MGLGPRKAGDKRRRRWQRQVAKGVSGLSFSNLERHWVSPGTAQMEPDGEEKFLWTFLASFMADSLPPGDSKKTHKSPKKEKTVLIKQSLQWRDQRSPGETLTYLLFQVLFSKETPDTVDGVGIGCKVQFFVLNSFSSLADTKHLEMCPC